MLLPGETYNNFKGEHTFIFIWLLYSHFRIIEMWEGKLGQRKEWEARREGTGAGCKKHGRRYRLELRTHERGERRRGKREKKRKINMRKEWGRRAKCNMESVGEWGTKGRRSKEDKKRWNKWEEGCNISLGVRTLTQHLRICDLGSCWMGPLGPWTCKVEQTWMYN